MRQVPALLQRDIDPLCAQMLHHAGRIRMKDFPCVRPVISTGGAACEKRRKSGERRGSRGSAPWSTRSRRRSSREMGSRISMLALSVMDAPSSARSGEGREGKAASRARLTRGAKRWPSKAKANPATRRVAAEL